MQFFGLITISTFILSIHLCRKMKPEHIKVLLDKLYQKDNALFNRYMKQIQQTNPKEYEKSIKQIHDKLN
jgi:hypothetical protein